MSKNLNTNNEGYFPKPLEGNIRRINREINFREKDPWDRRPNVSIDGPFYDLSDLSSGNYTAFFSFSILKSLDSRLSAMFPLFPVQVFDPQKTVDNSDPFTEWLILNLIRYNSIRGVSLEELQENRRLREVLAMTSLTTCAYVIGDNLKYINSYSNHNLVFSFKWEEKLIKVCLPLEGLQQGLLRLQKGFCQIPMRTLCRSVDIPIITIIQHIVSEDSLKASFYYNSLLATFALDETVNLERLEQSKHLCLPCLTNSAHLTTIEEGKHAYLVKMLKSDKNKKNKEGAKNKEARLEDDLQYLAKYLNRKLLQGNAQASLNAKRDDDLKRILDKQLGEDQWGIQP